MTLPGSSSPYARLSVESRTEDGRLKVIFREELPPAPAMELPPDYRGFVRDWNRRTGSAPGRTLSAGRTVTAVAPGASPPR
jgi:hypothetical protein